MVKDKIEESSSKSESRNAPIPSASWYVTYLAASVWTDSPDLSKRRAGAGYVRTRVREEGQVRARRVAHALSIVFASFVRGAVLTGWPILPGTRAARRAVKVDVKARRESRNRPKVRGALLRTC